MRSRLGLSLMLSVLLAACGGGSAPSPQGSAESTVQARGLVVDDQGLPLAGATVRVVSASTVSDTDIRASTDADGRFALTLDAATPVVLRVQKAGYASGMRAVTLASQNDNVADRVVLLPVASTQTFDPAQAAVLRVPGSAARVELSAGSLVREDGQPISGSVTVALTPVDPSADIGRMPGLMVDSASGEPIESLGALGVEFTDASGAPLNLAAGQTALIRIPATPAAGATLPATFPLYHLNEATGRWTQEGTATLHLDPATGAAYYEGTVGHFSTWNADRVMERANIDIGRSQDGGTCRVSAGLRVVSMGVNYNGTAQAQNGSLFVRADSRARIWLMDADGRVLDALELDTGATGSSAPLPRCLAEPPLVTVSGRVTLASGTLSNYAVQIRGDQMRAITVMPDAEGRYASQLYAGAGMLQAQLIGRVDRGTPDTSVTTTVASADVSFPDLVVNDTRFELPVCVQGWAGYRQSKVQLVLFRGGTMLGAPRTLTAGSPSTVFTGAPLSSTLTLRLTPPDASLADRTTTLVVGASAATLPVCLDLPRGPQAQLQVSGSGLLRNFDASASVAGDAALSRFQWDFGDGQSGQGVAPSHSYASGGSYLVQLTVTDTLGQRATATLPLIVSTGGGTVTVAGSPIDSGELHTCFITAAGGAACFGYDGYGQLGSGSLFTDPQPSAVVGLGSGVVEVAAGGELSCARTSTGTVWCWGNNNDGGLGVGASPAYSATPLELVSLGSGVQAISVGASHACAITQAGGLMCWGRNDFGTLGTGNNTHSNVPVPVSGLAAGVLAVSAGDVSTCAVVRGVGVMCWGAGHGNLPTTLAGLSDDVRAISLGGNHGCAVTATGAVKCWGGNFHGQLGNGSTTDSTAVVNVIGLGSGMVTVSAGSNFSCALTDAGQTWCWGTNAQGQLGDGSTTQRDTPVLATEQTGGAEALSTRGYATCVLRADRSTQCWGWLESYVPGG